MTERAEHRGGVPPSIPPSVPPSAPVAWRIWRAYWRFPGLQSLFYPGELVPPARVTAPAACDDHDVGPVADCTCGWYAIRSGADALAYGRGYDLYGHDLQLLVRTVVAVLPPYVEHDGGWRARRLALLAVADWPPPDPREGWSEFMRVWRTAIARAYAVPLVPPEIAMREFGAEW